MIVPLLFLSLQTTSPPPTYSDSATAALVRHARERHEYQDRLVRDYSATVRTRIDVAFGRSRFARLAPFAAHETAARITWALPNDLKVDVLGQRYATIFEGSEIDAAFDRPWFIPRSLGDSIRLVDDELPSTAALHPLSAGSEAHYTYAIMDSLTMELPGRTVHAVNVRVEPKQIGPSLVAGDLWLDRETVEVVRFTFVFVGEYLWDTPGEETPEDSARIREDNSWANRVIKLEADLEYALLDADYWMPYRQLVRLTVSIPFFLNATLPVRFITTFDDYEINQGVLPVFAAPPAPPDTSFEDSVDPDTTGVVSVNVGDHPRRRRRESFRCGDGAEQCDREEAGYFRVGQSERQGRWEVHYPPSDSLVYQWPDPIALGLSAEDERRLHETVATLGALAEDLPDQWVGRTRAGMAFESFSDIYRFNRVQGSSVGAGYRVDPGFDYTSLVGTARFGFGDRRVTGSLTWRRDAPAGRLDVTAYRTVRETESWTRGLGFANSLNALFTAHDDADYFLATGFGLRYQGNGAGFWRDFDFRAGYERHRTMRAFIKSDLADFFGSGRFVPNPVVQESDFVVAQLSRRSHFGRATFAQGLDALVDPSDSPTAGRAVRAWMALAVPFAVADRTHRLGVKGALTDGDPMPQLMNRVGGPQTVRGFPYGYRWGHQAWSAQLDIAVRDREDHTPVLFVDVGDAYDAAQLITPAGRADDGTSPMVGVGVGWSVLRGIIRLNLAYGVQPKWGWRFDLQFAAPR